MHWIGDLLIYWRNDPSPFEVRIGVDWIQSTVYRLSETCCFEILSRNDSSLHSANPSRETSEGYMLVGNSEI